MSNLVEQINDSLTSEIATALGATYSELDFIWDVSKNRFNQNEKRYGVRPMAMESTNQINKKYSVDQGFEVIVTTDYYNREDDESQRAAVFEVYDQMDIIIKNIHKKKAGLPSLVFNTMPFSVDEIEFLEDDGSTVAVLRAQFIINYRADLV